MTGARVYMYCDGILVNDILNDLGNQFTIYYFDLIMVCI